MSTCVSALLFSDHLDGMVWVSNQCWRCEADWSRTGADHGSYFPFPTTMKVHWDGELPAMKKM